MGRISNFISKKIQTSLKSNSINCVCTVCVFCTRDRKYCLIETLIFSCPFFWFKLNRTKTSIQRVFYFQRRLMLIFLPVPNKNLKIRSDLLKILLISDLVQVWSMFYLNTGTSVSVLKQIWILSKVQTCRGAEPDLLMCGASMHRSGLVQTCRDLELVC